ncbi:MAG: magnesium/cobalt transporter CorA [Candidatus Micrarchaeota archaeon]|nr:magnesium/cobalt transporter CorA [Candidatus Micrarchaeota archaeon]
MIEIITCNEKGERKCETLQHVNLGTKDIIWIDSENPTAEERKNIASALDLDMEEIMDSLDMEEHARIEVDDDYIYIIYTVPSIEEGEMETASFGIFIKGNIILTLHKKKIQALSKFGAALKRAKNGYLKKLAGRRYLLLANMLDHIDKDYLKALYNIDERLEELNDEIFKDPKEEHVQEIIRHRKTLIYFSRALLANRDVLILVKRGYLPDMIQDDVDNFIDLYSDVLQLIDMNTTFKELSNSAMSLYHSSLSNSMNILMKKLSFLAVLFVVPTLISGIYGMNFTFMPFLHDPMGFYYSLLAMALMIIALTIYLKINDI